ncbi:MAG: MutS-related protein, partial [Bacilli bacterium]
QTTIITGSNMAGKTTFIRGVGINILLAYAGARVCASSFEVSSLKIFTSIRVADDLSQGISTFYAEIYRIKQMVQYASLNKAMLCLIDEIFKGTNTNDRIYGAHQALEKLSKPWSSIILTTHDNELCHKKLTSRTIDNKHFSEYYLDDELLFDYQIKEGPCTTSNAIHILKMAQIIS